MGPPEPELDIAIVALGLRNLGTPAVDLAVAWAQVGMASAWGLVRVVYLFTRPR